MPGMRELSREESDRRAAAGEPFVFRFRVPREIERTVTFEDQVLRAAIQIDRGYRGFRAAAQQWDADVSHGVVRR